MRALFVGVELKFTNTVSFWRYFKMEPIVLYKRTEQAQPMKSHYVIDSLLMRVLYRSMGLKQSKKTLYGGMEQTIIQWELSL